MRNGRRARLVLTLLLLAAFTLITLDYRSNSLSGVRRGMSTVFGPVESALNHVTHPVGSWFSSIGHLGSYKRDNDKLRAQIATLEAKLHLTAAEQSELTQDQKLLHLAGLAQYTIVAARVVAVGSALDFDQTAAINVGSVNGVQPGQTVINGDGLVGRTVTVGRHSCTVLLANDPTFAVGARLEGKQLELGSAKGNGLGQPMTVTLLNTSVLPVVGQDLVTAGDPGNSPFVPEVPIGTITHVNPLNGGLTQTASVRPFVHFTSIDIVAIVIKAPKTIKHDLLLPASPTPAPTVTVTVTATPGGTPSTGSSGSSGTTGSPNSSTTP
jgi:rod shape-determining protein MreC